MKVGAIFSLAMALMLWLPSCRGSGEQIETAAPTKAQFLKKANAICMRANTEVNARFERYSRRHLTAGRAPSEQAYAEATARIVLPLVEDEIRTIRALGFPDGEEAKVGPILAAYEDGLEAGRKNPLLLAGGGRYAFSTAYARLIDYGLIRCALG